MGDEQVGQTAFFPQVQHEPQEFRPDRYIEHAHGLVGDHDLGVHHEGTGDHHPLTLAARQLVRIPGGEVRRGPQTGGFDRREDGRLPFRR